MFRYILSAFIVTASLAATTANAGLVQPKIEVSPMDFNVGAIDEGAKSNAKFTITNKGTAELTIYEVKPGCGCTVADISTRTLPPGGTATVDAVYDSHNATGDVKKFITLRCNDPDNQTLTLSISAHVKAIPAPDINLSLWNITNAQIPPGGSTARSIIVNNPGQQELVINEITVSQGMSAKIAGVEVVTGKTTKMSVRLKPGESTALDIIIAPTEKSGSFQEVLTVRSNSRRRPVVSFIGQGFIQ